MQLKYIETKKKFIMAKETKRHPYTLVSLYKTLIKKRYIFIAKLLFNIAFGITL